MIHTGLALTVGLTALRLPATEMAIAFELALPQVPLVTEQVYELELVRLPGAKVLAVAPLTKPEALYHW